MAAIMTRHEERPDSMPLLEDAPVNPTMTQLRIKLKVTNAAILRELVIVKGTLILAQQDCEGW